MTDKEKAKAYDEALERARKLYEQGTITESLGYVFPELKESEDERIRKAIHIYLDWLDGRNKDYQPKGDYSIKDMIAWLEKQKEYESTDFEYVWDRTDCGALTSALDKYSKEAIINMCHAWYDKGIELERKSWLEKQGKQKPTDKVEPKFKVGDWVVDNKNGIVKQILSYKHGVYKHTYGYSVKIFENEWRMWTINDAKDGDVLYSKKHNLLWLHKDLKQCYSCINLNYNNISISTDIIIPKDVYPATKEQRDLLFQKMKNAGYEWDEKKKELKLLITNGGDFFESVNCK